MGNRKDDISRMPKQRNRPLSAVLEEFELDDPDNKTPITNNDNNAKPTDSNHNVVRNACVSIPETPGDQSASDTSLTSEPNSPASGFNVPSSTPPTITVSFESNGSSSASRESSPKFPRRSSLRSGRRQALTPSLSPLLSRRGSSGLSRRLSSQSDVTDSDDETFSPSDMARLRQTAERLCLSTRRASTMQWRATYVESPDFPVLWNSSRNGDVTPEEAEGGVSGEKGGGSTWSDERTQRINTALDWIKNELMEMRSQDQSLARQLLTIRSDIHQLKLARSCEEHQDMLDDVQSELEDLQEFADVLDLPTHAITDSPLKHLGVTRMNFSARRFSTC